MKILFCNYEYPPLGGGGGVINQQIAEALAGRHEVTVLTSRGLGLPEESVENGVRVLRVPVLMRKQQAAASMVSMATYLPMAWLRGRRLFRQRPFDIVNTHFVVPTGPVGDALARFAGVPNVLSVHGGDLYDPSKWSSPHRHLPLRLAVRRLLRRADRVVGQSRNTLENMRRYFTPELEGECIPLGIRRPPPVEADRGRYGWREEEVVMVTVGRLVARKAVDQLLELLSRMAGHPARLVVIGSGPQEGALRALAGDLGVEDRVLFTGQVEEEEKFRLLRSADLFVSTSQHEGFGLVFVEAMACGLPVVCYDHGGQTDFLADGVTGGLVPLNDRQKMLESCLAFVCDGERRRRVGEANARLAESYFVETCASRYESLFEQLVAETRRGGN